MSYPADPKSFLTALFDVAVAAADPMKVVAPFLPDHPDGRLFVIGAGKASARMAQAVEAHYGAVGTAVPGYVITRYGYSKPTETIEIVEAAHPVPDAAGEAATRKLMDLAQGFGPDDTVLALISGGGSALLCAPNSGLSLKDKMALNAALLASGAPISEMNAVRKRLSLVKGGKLARAVHPAQLTTLMISDVPGDDPALIASGPTVPDAGSAAQAIEILDRRNVSVPGHVRAAILTSEDGPTARDPIFGTQSQHIVAAPSMSLQAAADLAEQMLPACEVRLLGDALEGEARDLAKAQIAEAIDIQSAMSPKDAPILLLSGGECTVTRKGNGIGGPNAEYVLAATIALSDKPGIHVLACDTDGVDGAADVAGAFGNSETATKAAAQGIDISTMLAENDAHTFFARIDDQIVPGPTFTNVNDFRAILITPAA